MMILRGIFSIAVVSFSAAPACAGTMTDSRDGHVYETVQIGNQTWMAQNLNFDVNDSYCYNHSDASCGELGPLYSMIAARNDVCPEGWILPSEEDVLTMLKNVKDFRAEFKPLAGGFRTPGDDYYNIGVNGYFWTSTKLKKGKGKYFYWVAANDSVKWLGGDEFSAMSVRCLKKDGAAAKTGAFVDPRDKKSYKTVEIAGKTWLAENLSYRTEESICYEDKATNCEKHGRLYNLKDARQACPAGWHLPKPGEYGDMFSGLVKSKTRRHCFFGESSGNCSDDAYTDFLYWEKISGKLEKRGFSTKQLGYKKFYSMEGGEENRFKKGLVFWTAPESDMDEAEYIEFSANGTAEAVNGLGPFGCQGSCGTNFYSIRCVKDN